MSDQGRSTSDRYIDPNAGDAWAAEAASQGKTGSQRLLNVAVTAPGEEARQALNLKPDEQVVVRSRLIIADDQPIEIATSYYPASIAASTVLARPGKVRGGSPAELARLGHSVVDVTDTVTARHPSPDESAILHVGDHEPLLVLTRVSLDIDGRPVEYAVNVSVAALSAPHVYHRRVSAP